MTMKWQGPNTTMVTISHWPLSKKLSGSWMGENELMGNSPEMQKPGTDFMILKIGFSFPWKAQKEVRFRGWNYRVILVAHNVDGPSVSGYLNGQEMAILGMKDGFEFHTPLLSQSFVGNRTGKVVVQFLVGRASEIWMGRSDDKPVQPHDRCYKYLLKVSNYFTWSRLGLSKALIKQILPSSDGGKRGWE